MTDRIKVLPFTKPEIATKQEIIDILTEILKQAEQGQIIEVMASCVCSDNTYATWYSGSADLVRISGHLQRQLYLTNKRMDGDDEED